MTRLRIASFALLLPAVLLALGGVLGDIAVCVAEECDTAHSASAAPESGCEHPDHEAEADETPLHWGCTPVSCRYIPVKVVAAPAGAKDVSDSDLDEVAETVGDAIPFGVDFEQQASPILHLPAPRLRQVKLSTVMRF